MIISKKCENQPLVIIMIILMLLLVYFFLICFWGIPGVRVHVGGEEILIIILKVENLGTCMWK